MISDVLFEARHEIERYQRDFNNYDDDEMREELEVVKAVTANCQRRLDLPPPAHDEGKAPKPLLWKDVPRAKRALKILRMYQEADAAYERKNAWRQDPAVLGWKEQLKNRATTYLLSIVNGDPGAVEPSHWNACLCLLDDRARMMKRVDGVATYTDGVGNAWTEKQPIVKEDEAAAAD
jgi:hypothetical protein